MNFLNNNDVVDEYKKLLKVGRQRISGNAPNDLEQHAEFDKLLQLNDYVYTYYSTNEGDDTYSIEFVVLSSFLEPLLKKLKENGLWFLAKDYYSGKYSENYDKSKNDETKPDKIIVNSTSLSRYRLKSDESPDGWEIVDKSSDDKKITLKREQKIHFLESGTIADIKKGYEEGNYFLNMSFIPELADKSKIDIELLAKNVAVVMIEDPVVNQTTLYDVLLEICREVIQLPQDSGAAASRKSLSTKKGKMGKGGGKSLSRKRGKVGKGGNSKSGRSGQTRKNS